MTYRYETSLETLRSMSRTPLPWYTVVGSAPGVGSDRVISTYAKSWAFGFFQRRRTSRLPTLTVTPVTSSGGVRSTTVGGSCGVPAGGCGRTVSTAVPSELLPLASVATNLIVSLPTGSVRGASFVTWGLSSTRSVAATAFRNDCTTGSSAEIPAALVA